jgi:uncharacterized protein (TIGR03000 family)
MSQRNVRKLMMASIVTLVTLGMNLTEANAFWWRGGSSGGSSGGYGSSGGSSGGWGSSGGYSSGGSSGGWGSSGGGSSGGGLFRHHWHRASYWGVGYGSSGGSSGGWGSSGGSSGGWGSSGGSSGGWGSSGGSSGGYMMPGTSAPVMTPGQPGMMTPAPAPAPGPAPAPMTSLQRSATLVVSVPKDARVFVNDKATTSTGEIRRYVSNNLEPGYSYTYTLRAEMIVDGKTVTETKVIKVRAGETADLAFALNGEDEGKIAEQPGRTTLTLNVPADAKVYLSGTATQSAGTVREFTTAKLTNGQEWKDYTVRVEIERDGQKIAKEEHLTLRGGENRELSIDFDAPQVASTR